MRKSCFLALIFAIFTVFKINTANAGYPQYKNELNIAFGMTVEEVKEKLPNIEPKENGNFVGPIIVIDGTEYKVSLHFDNNKLSYIHFKTKLKPKTFEEAYKHYCKVGKDLSLQYGTPINKSGLIFSSKESDQSFYVEWLDKDTEVNLGFTGADSYSLTISYGLKDIQKNKKVEPSKKDKRPQTEIMPIFADIAWYTNREDAKNKLVNMGYVLEEEISHTWVPNLSNSTIIKFSGIVSGQNSSIITLFDDQDMLLKVVVKIPAKDDYLGTYFGLCQQLKKKYGKPWSEYEKFEYPFKKGDGHLELALKSSKAFFSTRWAHDVNYLNITIDSSLDVRLDYESWGLNSYLEFKEKSTQKDL